MKVSFKNTPYVYGNFNTNYNTIYGSAQKTCQNSNFSKTIFSNNTSFMSAFDSVENYNKAKINLDNTDYQNKSLEELKTHEIEKLDNARMAYSEMGSEDKNRKEQVDSILDYEKKMFKNAGYKRIRKIK